MTKYGKFSLTVVNIDQTNCSQFFNTLFQYIPQYRFLSQNMSYLSVFVLLTIKNKCTLFTRSLAVINSWPTFSPYLYNRVYSELTCCNSLSWLVHAWVDTSSQEFVYFTLRKSPLTSWIKIVSPLSTADNTRGYARVSHSRQWSNYNILLLY